MLESNIEEYERLSRMIDSMLFLARTESPSRKLSCDSVDLGEMVLQLCEYFEGMAEDGARALTNQASSDMVRGRVSIESLWSPAMTDLKKRNIKVRMAAPTEGYRAWYGGM